MPTNLPPEYFEVEKRFRAAKSPAEKVALLEELISTVPKHKGTDHLRADLRRRLSQLRAEARSKKGVSRRESVFRIEREGAGQVVVVGPANVGKSALVAALTNATPEVADYPYTTWEPTPGMMPVEDIQIQLVDTPPLDRNYVEPELIDLIRRSDLILLMVDLQTDPLGQLEEALAILRENRIVPLHWKEQYSEDERVTFKPFLVLANKADDEASDELFELFCQLLDEEWPCLPVSAATGRNLEGLKRAVFENLGIIRVYAKPPGKEPDFSAPFVLKKGSTVQDLAGKVHKDFLEKLTAARVWGSAEFDGQMVQRDYVLHDGDVVELRI
ncbi:MAG: TGS domain-containing protein [Chloroflexi bacterium]|nr:TGS domain-containing protein [Chloroflexota bacterium]